MNHELISKDQAFLKETLITLIPILDSLPGVIEPEVIISSYINGIYPKDELAEGTISQLSELYRQYLKIAVARAVAYSEDASTPEMEEYVSSYQKEIYTQVGAVSEVVKLVQSVNHDISPEKLKQNEEMIQYVHTNMISMLAYEAEQKETLSILDELI